MNDGMNPFERKKKTTTTTGNRDIGGKFGNMKDTINKNEIDIGGGGGTKVTGSGGGTGLISFIWYFIVFILAIVPLYIMFFSGMNNFPGIFSQVTNNINYGVGDINNKLRTVLMILSSVFGMIAILFIVLTPFKLKSGLYYSLMHIGKSLEVLKGSDLKSTNRELFVALRTKVAVYGIILLALVAVYYYLIIGIVKAVFSGNPDIMTIIFIIIQGLSIIFANHFLIITALNGFDPAPKGITQGVYDYDSNINDKLKQKAVSNNGVLSGIILLLVNIAIFSLSVYIAGNIVHKIEEKNIPGFGNTESNVLYDGGGNSDGISNDGFLGDF